jgi:hypothetical protein
MNATERQLLSLFRALGEAQRQSLLDFASFLAGREKQGEGAGPTEPLDLPRPAQETVVKAIKRLMATYPMLDRSKLFHDTAHHMTQHVMHGRPAIEVIDELEVVFKRHYQVYLENKG